jgi:hypothetical protein
MKLGYGDRRVVAPENATELINFLGQIMASAINNEVDIDNAKLALNAATRIVDVWQADTRMKALAIASGRLVDRSSGWGLIDEQPRLVDTEAAK